MALLLVRHFQNDHWVCLGPTGACLALASAARFRFIFWIFVRVIGDLLLIARWLVLGTKVDPRLSHQDVTIIPADERPPRRQLDVAFSYQTMPEDLLLSHSRTNEDHLD